MGSVVMTFQLSHRTTTASAAVAAMEAVLEYGEELGVEQRVA
jgi:hypothetical protein